MLETGLLVTCAPVSSGGRSKSPVAMDGTVCEALLEEEAKLNGRGSVAKGAFDARGLAFLEGSLELGRTEVAYG